jgi:hypothetical protein
MRIKRLLEAKYLNMQLVLSKIFGGVEHVMTS